MTDADVTARLAEALQTADAQDRRLDGYKLDVIHRYAAALLPVVRDLQAQEREALEQIDAIVTGRVHLGPTSLGRVSAILDYTLRGDA
jgi:hypothetical protein